MNKRGSILITLGLLFLAGALGLTLYNVWDANRAGEASEAVAQEMRAQLGIVSPEPLSALTEEKPTDAAAEETKEATTEPAEETEEPTEEGETEETQEHREMPTMEINGYKYIGILDVESMDISLPVMEEWDYDRLKVAPCRFAGNVYDDDLVICAHNYATHFAPLKYAPIGTQVKFTDAEGTEFYYEIVDFDTIGPNDVEGMIYGDWDLTLFTCNTNGQTRCAIRCQRVA